MVVTFVEQPSASVPPGDGYTAFGRWHLGSFDELKVFVVGGGVPCSTRLDLPDFIGGVWV